MRARGLLASPASSVLLVLAAAVFVILRNAGTKLPDLPTGPAVLTLALSGLGTFFYLIRFLFPPGALGYHLDRRYGLFITVILAIVQTVVAFRAFKSSGEKLPNLGSSGSSS